MRTQLSGNNHIALPSAVHILWLGFSSNVSVLFLFMFDRILNINGIINIIHYIHVKYSCIRSFKSAVFRYNGWNSSLLRSPQCKQTYVKQFIPCKIKEQEGQRCPKRRVAQAAIRLATAVITFRNKERNVRSPS